MKAKLALLFLFLICLASCNDYFFVEYSSYYQAGAVLSPYIIGFNILFFLYCFYLFQFGSLSKEEKEQRKKPVRRFLGNFFAVGAMTVGVGLLFTIFLCGWACLINRSFGQQEKVVLQGTVREIKHEAGHRSTNVMCRVTIEEEGSGRVITIDLSTKHEKYERGQVFSKEMNRGCLGFYYLVANPVTHP